MDWEINRPIGAAAAVEQAVYWTLSVRREPRRK